MTDTWTGVMRLLDGASEALARQQIQVDALTEMARGEPMRDFVRDICEATPGIPALASVEAVIRIMERKTFDQLVHQAASDYDETPEDIEAMDPERFRQIVGAYFDKASDEIVEAICGYEKRLNEYFLKDDWLAMGEVLKTAMVDYVRPHFAKALEAERAERAHDRAEHLASVRSDDLGPEPLESWQERAERLDVRPR